MAGRGSLKRKAGRSSPERSPLPAPPPQKEPGQPLCSRQAGKSGALPLGPDSVEQPTAVNFSGAVRRRLLLPLTGSARPRRPEGGGPGRSSPAPPRRGSPSSLSARGRGDARREPPATPVSPRSPPSTAAAAAPAAAPQEQPHPRAPPEGHQGQEAAGPDAQTATPLVPPRLSSPASFATEVAGCLAKQPHTHTHTPAALPPQISRAQGRQPGPKRGPFAPGRRS